MAKSDPVSGSEVATHCKILYSPDFVRYRFVKFMVGSPEASLVISFSVSITSSG